MHSGVPWSGTLDLLYKLCVLLADSCLHDDHTELSLPVLPVRLLPVSRSNHRIVQENSGLTVDFCDGCKKLHSKQDACNACE